MHLQRHRQDATRAGGFAHRLPLTHRLQMALGRLALGVSLLLLTAIPADAAKSEAAQAEAETVALDALTSERFQGLKWRNIGPYRGGRVTAVTGVVGQPTTFYMGATGGGIWKTEDAGTTWNNISDGFVQTGSVGALAVAPSDSNVVYAGMGEAQIRGVTTTHGDGVYVSTDGGRSWDHRGLAATRQISRIRVHPDDPDVVYVAAQGNPWIDSPERGIYRSVDGGRHWLRVLEVDETTGASDLAMDPTNPRVLYAAFWQHRRLPWKVISGGPGSGLFKSTDGGDTWERIEKGLPVNSSSALGKIGVAVSPVNPQRVWALVEADDGGLFRSDDGGKSFVHVNRKRLLRARSWYYTKVFADPRDANTVYVLNAPMLRSIDGGRTFEPVKTPHGDNHDLWVSPDRPWRMINGNDGGANVSWNEGTSWTTQANQPTGQFYRVITDGRFPYFVYGGQQDNSAIAIASQGLGGIGPEHRYSVGGCESAHIAFDPEQPDVTYAGCYQGLITAREVNTGRQRNIMAYPYLGLGSEAREQRYRFNWNAPIVVSPHDASVLYHAGDVVLRSVDGGLSWRQISDDLTRNEIDRQGPGGGPITNEAAGAENYNTIFYLAPSPHRPGELWAGTDDGLVHVTRSEGESWTDVTPTPLRDPERPSAVNSIEISPHHPDSVYLAVNRYKLGDDAPYIYLTEDGGETWQLRVAGIDDGAFVRAVREDPERPGLLYAGTEAGLYVSVDRGRQWKSLQLKLPRVPITDLTLRQGDLIAATQGRGFWILDDLSPLRQWGRPAIDAVPAEAESSAALSAAEPVVSRLAKSQAAVDEMMHLYRPSDAYRLPSLGSVGKHRGANPPQGAILYYDLSQRAIERLQPPSDEPVGLEMENGAAESGEAEGSEAEEAETRDELVLEILDGSGKVIRRFSNHKAEVDAIDPPPSPSEFGYSKPDVLPAQVGLNRFVWDLEAEQVRQVDDLFVFGAKTYRVVPGTFTVRLTLGDTQQEHPLDVLPDPRHDLSAEDFDEQRDLMLTIWRRVDHLHRDVTRLRDVREQVEARLQRLENHERLADIADLGHALIERIDAWEEPLVQPQQKTFQDVINFPNKLNSHYLFLLQVVAASDPPVSEGVRLRWQDLEAEWLQHKVAMERIYAIDLATFNQRFVEQQIPAIVVPGLE